MGDHTLKMSTEYLYSNFTCTYGYIFKIFRLFLSSILEKVAKHIIVVSQESVRFFLG